MGLGWLVGDTHRLWLWLGLGLDHACCSLVDVIGPTRNQARARAQARAQARAEAPVDNVELYRGCNQRSRWHVRWRVGARCYGLLKHELAQTFAQEAHGREFEDGLPLGVLVLQPRLVVVEEAWAGLVCLIHSNDLLAFLQRPAQLLLHEFIVQARCLRVVFCGFGLVSSIS